MYSLVITSSSCFISAARCALVRPIDRENRGSKYFGVTLRAGSRATDVKVSRCSRLGLLELFGGSLKTKEGERSKARKERRVNRMQNIKEVIAFQQASRIVSRVTKDQLTALVYTCGGSSHFINIIDNWRFPRKVPMEVTNRRLTLKVFSQILCS
jgi:hypothetical protein